MADAPALSSKQGNWAFATSLALLLLRLALGWTFIYHGSQKLFGAFGGSGIEGVVKITENLGMPGFLSPKGWAYMLACGEFFGGVSIFLGLLARLGAIPILISMGVAIAKVHGPIGFTNSKPGGLPGYEFNANLIAMAAAILIAGPGLVSLDALIFRRGLWARGPQPLDQPGTRK